MLWYNGGIPVGAGGGVSPTPPSDGTAGRPPMEQRTVLHRTITTTTGASGLTVIASLTLEEGSHRVVTQSFRQLTRAEAEQLVEDLNGTFPMPGDVVLGSGESADGWVLVPSLFDDHGD